MNTNRRNKNKSNNQSFAKKISFCSIMCALSVIILSLGSIIEVIDITTAALASFVVIIVMLELRGYYPILLYFATSALSFLLLPNKTVSLMYILFFGFYPILKKYLERPRSLISWITKFALFNLIFWAYYILAKHLFFPDLEQIKIPLTLLVNTVFFTFDLALTFFVTAYVRKFRRLLQIHRFFK